MRAPGRMTVVVLHAVLASGARAQTQEPSRTEDCSVQTTEDSRQNFYNQGELSFFGGGATFVCRDGRRIRADSVERYRSSGIVNFIGRVRYQDRENVLTSSYVRYMENDRQATAQGNVVLTERATGSVLSGPYMHYYQASNTRPEALIQLPQGRPHALLLSKAKADTTRRDTTVVDADGMEIIGRSRFEARGNVVLVREDLTGTGGSATYEREQGDLRLWITAKLETEDYTLTGDTIHGVTNADDELERVTATGKGVLDSEEVDVRAPRIRVEFEAGEVSRLIAVGDSPADSAADPTRQAVAVSEDFQITADSIDALAPARQLEQVFAAGRAHGERLGADLGNANVPAVAARDWMKGDTITTRFIESKPDSSRPAVADTARPGREVESVLAIGVTERAASLYRVQDKEDPTAPVAISYTLARRILVTMVAGEVARVQAAVEVQGLHLDPIRRVPAQTTTAANGGRRPPR